MEYQEREQLGQFLQGLAQARVEQKDREAETMIREACARQPDAAYLLVQRAMLTEHALNDARSAIARLQSELNGARSERPFLADNNAWGSAPVQPAAPRQTAPQMPAQAPAFQAPTAAAPAAPAWGGSFLGNVASTAVGVAAGSFLFQGLGNLFGGHHGGGFSGASGGSQPLADTHEIVTEDNYDGGVASADGLDDLGPSGEEWA